MEKSPLTFSSDYECQRPHLANSSLCLENSVWHSGCACMLSEVMSDSAIPWTVAHQAPLSTGFPRQEYWSGLPFPSPGDLPNSGIKAASPVLQADCLPLSHRKPACRKAAR